MYYHHNDPGFAVLFFLLLVTGILFLIPSKPVTPSPSYTPPPSQQLITMRAYSLEDRIDWSYHMKRNPEERDLTANGTHALTTAPWTRCAGPRSMMGETIIVSLRRGDLLKLVIDDTGPWPNTSMPGDLRLEVRVKTEQEARNFGIQTGWLCSTGESE